MHEPQIPLDPVADLIDVLDIKPQALPNLLVEPSGCHTAESSEAKFWLKPLSQLCEPWSITGRLTVSTLTF